MVTTDPRSPGANPYAPPTASLEDVGGGSPGSRPGDARYRSLAPLARAATVIVVLLVLAELATLVNAVVSISVMSAVESGETPEAGVLEAVDTRTTILEAAQLAVTVSMVVLFCLLMPRANRNARSFGATDLEFTPRWAAGWFFVPIVSLWRPYRALKEIWQASEPRPDPRLLRSSREVPALLPLWWAAFIVNQISGNASGRLAASAETPGLFILANKVEAVSSASGVIAAVLALAVVRALARRQTERHALEGTAGAAGPLAPFPPTP